MGTLNLENSFNRRVALVVVATLLVLIALTSTLNSAPLRSAFAGQSQVEIALHR
ncbi:MAG: hypothetical protein H0T53_13830 [Herpetosiphonaceae bacterium]|nr:hypothetical protein [Herpetosiphonaceae bacterium]